MFSWARVKVPLAYFLTFSLIAITFFVVQSQADNEEPSAEGQLSKYFEQQVQAASSITGQPYPGDVYPRDVYPGDGQPFYPGDEKWDGQYVSSYLPNPLYPTDISALATDGRYIYIGGMNLPLHPELPSYSLARWENGQ